MEWYQSRRNLLWADFALASIDSFLNQTAGTMLFLTYFNLLCPVEKVII